MSQRGTDRKPERLRGVAEVPDWLGGYRFRARISRGRGRQVNLGLYPTRWLAAFAYNIAAESLHGASRSRNEVPETEQPDADEVRRIVARVRRCLGLDDPFPTPDEPPPSPEQVMTLFEITVVGFWRGHVVEHAAELGRELNLASRRLVEAAHVLFGNRAPGDPTPLEALSDVLARRLDRTFRRADLTREVLDDEGDDEVRISRWLVHPDDPIGAVGFREAIGHVYSELLGTTSTVIGSGAIPSWAAILGVEPPFTSEQVRAAYRVRSKSLHPDTGGSHAEFIRLQSAYDEACRYCGSRGV